MNEIQLNSSRKSMLMNEIAFPCTALNTIAIRIHFPTCDIQSVCHAVNHVIDNTDIFGLRLIKNETGTFIFSDSMEHRTYCTTLTKQSRKKAEDFCSMCETKPFMNFPECGLYSATAIPLTDGSTMLSFRFHHVLVDGYSMCQIAQRILDVLNGKPISKCTICSEEDTELTNPKEQKDFWLDYFDDAQFEVSILPGSPTEYNRTCYHYSLTEELTAKIEHFAQEHKITPATVFSGAFARYLAGVGQSSDAVFMMPRTGRDNETQRESIGCHTLIVPVRVPVQENTTFLDLCKTTLSQARSASAHKHYGIDRIVKDLKNGGVIDGAFSEYTINFYRPSLYSDKPFEILLSMDGAMHNHLTINITKLQNTYELCYDGRDGVYSAELVDYFHDAYTGIIENGIDNNPMLRTLPLVGEHECSDLLNLKGNSLEISDTDSIPSLFRQAVLKHGDCPALYAGKDQLSFDELDRLSNRVANALIKYGTKQGEPILYMMNRDIRLIPIMFGILKAGAAFIPVDPQYPKERIDYILENSHATFFVSSKNVDGSSNFSYLEADELLEYNDESGDFPEILQEQLAYCIYTSGTTGNPKGVMLSHRGIVNIANQKNNPFNRDICENGKGIVCIGSICFDISLFEIFVPLFNGMFVELATENALLDPNALAELITAHGANILHCTPSRLAAYLHNDNFEKAIKTVNMILAAGEVLPPTLAAELHEKYAIRIYNGYGPTETTIGATITEANDTLTIGRPIANMGIIILDKNGQLLPFGASGEIGIYGDGVGIGYAGMPKQTAQNFVTLYNRRLYKTGDLGQLLLDGRVIYRGRNDHQVKLRGLRIELSEIENKLEEFPGVGTAHVLVRTVNVASHLVGFYTVKSGFNVDTEKLKTLLKESLPLYMVPDILKELPSIPHTPGGKVDLHALKTEPVEFVREYRAPSNKTEQAICLAFETVLKISKVSANDTFFEIGGDSLHTAELLSEIENLLPGVTISFEDVFHYPSPALLAQHLNSQTSSKTNVAPISQLDYSGINEILATSASSPLGEENLGNVLLTGVTGFLGCHILIELLNHPEKWNKIWCLVRPGVRSTAIKRLRSTLFYYSEDDYSDFFGERLFVIEGDITDETAFIDTFYEKINTVLNSAADVSHFAYDDKLNKINTGGVKNLLSFCKNQAATFVQVSTISVAGTYPSNATPLTLTEHSLFIGQEIRNQYVLSKFMAEYECLRATTDFQIPIRIMRVGNLQGRISDGEFQMKNKTNAFTRMIASYVKIGAVPVSLYQRSVNFSPVDEVAKMIVALAGTDAQASIYHIFPPQEVLYSELFDALGKLGHPVQVISDDEFDKKISSLGKSKQGKALTEGILLEHPDMNHRDSEVADLITTNVISSFGMDWAPITPEYLDKYFSALEDLQMFN